MINKLVKESTEKPEPKAQTSTEKKPNEVGGVYFSSHVKITDPDTNEVLLSKRGDD